jgi:tRNA(Ile)-lysidine synthase
MKKESLTKRSKKSSPLSKSTLSPHKALASPFVRRFIKRVQNTVKKFELWKTGDSFIVGVSGGPDSLCLLDVLTMLQKKYDFTLHVAHVNYHLRGKASALDEALTKKMAARHHLSLTVLSQKKNIKSASEEALRTIRYAFFETLRKKYKARHIVVAHNQDDQAETLLLRLLRGAGLSGLSAMRAKNNSVIRPLIEMSRADILRYLEERSLAFREDASNADVRYFRNRIRHGLIPYLEKEFQPQTRKLLAETALLLGDDYASSQNTPHALPTKQSPNSLEFSRSALLSLSEARLRYELRALLKPLLSGKNPNKNVINELVKSLKSAKNKTKTVTLKGLKFVVKSDTVTLLYL